MNIRIIRIPPGEAPESIRQAWVGLVLPLTPGCERVCSTHTYGVLSGPRTFLGELFRRLTGRLRRKAGYVVDVQAAIDILEDAAPAAAAWWRENVPHAMRPGRRFLFAPDACEVLG